MKGDKQLSHIYKWVTQNVDTCTPLSSSKRRSLKPVLLIHTEARGLCSCRAGMKLQLVSAKMKSLMQ